PVEVVTASAIARFQTAAWAHGTAAHSLAAVVAQLGPAALAALPAWAAAEAAGSVAVAEGEDSCNQGHLNRNTKKKEKTYETTAIEHQPTPNSSRAAGNRLVLCLNHKGADPGKGPGPDPATARDAVFVGAGRQSLRYTATRSRRTDQGGREL